MSGLFPPVFSIKYIRVSDLCYFIMCPKRVMIEQGLRQYPQGPKSEAMKVGIRMHEQLSLPYQTIYREELRYRLGWRVHSRKEEPIFQRQIGNWIIRGTPDDFEVRKDLKTGKIQVGLIERRTTTKKCLTSYEYEVKVLQAQIYMWLLTPELAKYPVYEYWVNSHVDVYSQKPKSLIKTIPVTPICDKYLEHIIKILDKEEPILYPPEWVCKRCPQRDKIRCWKYRDMYPEKIKRLEEKLYGKLSS